MTNGAEDELRKKRHESVQRLKSTWELINEKYGSVLPEEDDEIDLRRCKIVKDRGYLRRQDRREFGEMSDLEDEEESSILGGPETVAFDSDEDELGDWEGRSGLDLQMPEPEEEPPPPKRTQEDDEDLKSFLRAESERRLALGNDDRRSGRSSDSSSRSSSSGGSTSGDDDGGWTSSSWGPGETFGMSSRSRGSSISVGLDDLFKEDDSVEASEDELLRQDSDAEEATRVVAAKPLRDTVCSDQHRAHS